MIRRGATVLSTLAVAISVAAWAAAPSVGSPQSRMLPDSLGEWRFPVGERMEYSVSFGRVRLGTGSLSVEAIDTVWSRPAYRVALEMEGGPPFYRVEDRQVSWMTPAPLASVRFDQQLREGKHRRDRRYMLDPDALTYTRYDNIKGKYVRKPAHAEIPIPRGALDDISFIYMVRLLPLEVGQRYEFRRYFREKGNPVVIEVLRREEIRVPAGRFETIVIRPTIRTSGLFGEGGEAELYLSDDDRRVIVRLKTSLSVGSGNMYLTSYEPGTSDAFISSATPAEAQATSGDSTAAGGGPHRAGSE